MDNPLMKRPAYRSVWIEILLLASHNEKKEVSFGGKQRILKPGQFTTGAYQLGVRSGVPRGTVERILKRFKSEEQIEVQTDRQCSLITVKNWEKYQDNKEQSEERVRNDRGTSEERVRTNQTLKNEKNEKNTIATPSREEKPFDLSTELNKLLSDPKPHIQIIGLFIKAKKLTIENHGQLQSVIKRNVRSAQAIKDYPRNKIIATMKHLVDNADFKWTLETVGKYIDELDTIKTRDESPEEAYQRITNKYAKN